MSSICRLLTAKGQCCDCPEYAVFPGDPHHPVILLRSSLGAF